MPVRLGSHMTTKTWFVEAVLDEMRIAFALQDVDRILRAVAIHAVPQAGGCLLGAIDVAGELVPVFDLRRMLGLPSRALHPEDRMILMRQPRCALLVDHVVGTAAPGPLELAQEFSLRAAGLRGVARNNDGVMLVQDLSRLLALERAIPIASHA